MSRVSVSRAGGLVCAALRASKQGLLSGCCWLAVFACAVIACSSTVSDERSQQASSSAGASSLAQPGWCAVSVILREKCQICHQSPTLHGAPFALVTYQDTRAADVKGKLRFEQIADAVETEYMPPQFIALSPPVVPLTPEERSTLLAWCMQGAPLNDDTSCVNAR